jgi:hypothetical protein
MRPPRRQLILLALGLAATWVARAQPNAEDTAIDLAIRAMLDADEPDRIAALAAPLAVAGLTGAVAPLIQLLYWLDADLHPPVAEALAAITGADFGLSWFDWMVWQERHPEMHPYALFPGLLADLLAGLDSRYTRLVKPDSPATIRWEELVWGSLTPDGMPPLDHPDVIPSFAADYLADTDMVFAARIGGIPRAWPHRIMVWHEIVNDTLGGQPITLAYCLLSGAPILYATSRRDAAPYSFATSGLLLRSNKLMFDRQTDSLWSQIIGRPVLGPLVGGAPPLARLPLVTTTWGAWRDAHPETTVLSLETGHRRDYAEGAAYAGYFGSPTLYFPAALDDASLPPKSRIFGLHHEGTSRAWPLARFAGGAVIRDRIAGQPLVLLGDGGREDIRAYLGDAVAFSPESWRVTEEALLGPAGESLPRLPGHTAFWFAWAAQFPGTLAAAP